MPQLHLYVPESEAAELRKKAKRKGMSLSRYLAQLVRKDSRNDWPRGFFEEVVGGWRGEPLRRPEQGVYETRAEM